MLPMKSLEVSKEFWKMASGTSRGYVKGSVVLSGIAPANLVAFAITVSYEGIAAVSP